MFEHFNTLRVLFQSAKPAMSRYLEVASIDALEQEMTERTATHQPIVMVYGVYNAGKSTLINALLGEERAEVGDIPKTDRVDPYQMGDVTILDTPGIDAPIEHEQITREQLSKSDAVIFVLSSDGVLEEHSTYQEIEKILRADKPMLVVINNRSGYKTNDPIYVALQEKFRSNLYSHFAGDEQLLARLDKVPTHLVNAKTALKGKLENKPTLVEISRLPELVKAVQRLFHETDSTQVAKTLSIQLQALLQQAIEKARSDSKDPDLAKLQELISDVRQSQTAVTQKTLNHAERGRALLKSQLYQMLQDGNRNVEPVLEQWKTDQSNYFEEQITREMRRLDSEAAEVSRLLLRTPGDMSFGIEQEDGDDGQGFSNLAGFLMQEGLKLGANKIDVTRGMIEVMKQGKSWFPSLFKGIGPKTMGKMAGKAAPFVGPTIDVIMAGWDYYKAQEVEARQIRKKRGHLEFVNLKVSEMVDGFYESLTDSVEDSTNDSYQPLIKSLQQSLETLSGESSKLNADIATMQASSQKLQQAIR